MSTPLFVGRVERWEFDSRYHPISGVQTRFDVRFADKDEADRFYDFLTANVGLSQTLPPEPPK